MEASAQHTQSLKDNLNIDKSPCKDVLSKRKTVQPRFITGPQIKMGDKEAARQRLQQLLKKQTQPQCRRESNSNLKFQKQQTHDQILDQEEAGVSPFNLEK